MAPDWPTLFWWTMRAKELRPSIVDIFSYNDTGLNIYHGYGFFINGQGDIITTLHVLRGASSLKVKLWDGSIHSVRSIIAENDLSLLVCLSTDVPPLLSLAVSHADRPRKNSDISCIQSLDEIDAGILSPYLNTKVLPGCLQETREVSAGSKVIEISKAVACGIPVIQRDYKVTGVGIHHYAIPFNHFVQFYRVKELSIAEWQKKWLGCISHEVSEHYIEGILSIYAGVHEQAINRLREVINSGHERAAVHCHLGFCYAQAGGYAEAAEEYNKALSMNSAFLEALLGLGYVYHKVKRWTAAVEQYEKAIALWPAHTEVSCFLWKALRKLGKYTEAVKVVKDAAVAYEHNFGEASFGWTMAAFDLDSIKTARNENVLVKPCC